MEADEALLSYLTEHQNKGFKITPIINSEDLNNSLDFIMGVRNLSCDKNIDAKIKFVEDMFLLVNLRPVTLKYASNIEVKNSKIHGRGVFAKTKIPKNTVVTFYPAHAIHLDTDLVAIEDNFIKKVKECKYDKLYGISEHSYNYSFLNIIGDPNQTDNPQLLGHMLNDAVGNVFSGINFDKLNDKILFKNTTAKYIILGMKNRNCIIKYHKKYPLAYILTTRDIEKDEELLLLYGTMYWFDHQYDKNCQQDNIFTDLFRGVCDPEFLRWMVATIPEFYEYVEDRCKKIES